MEFDGFQFFIKHCESVIEMAAAAAVPAGVILCDSMNPNTYQVNPTRNGIICRNPAIYQCSTAICGGNREAHHENTNRFAIYYCEKCYVHYHKDLSSYHYPIFLQTGEHINETYIQLIYTQLPQLITEFNKLGMADWAKAFITQYNSIQHNNNILYPIELYNFYKFVENELINLMNEMQQHAIATSLAEQKQNGGFHKQSRRKRRTHRKRKTQKK